MAVLQPSLGYGCEVCHNNKRQAKAFESIQLRTRKHILGCPVTTCDEPVHADLGLQTLKSRRHFSKLEWYRMVMCTNCKRSPAKLLPNKWDNVKCRGHQRKLWCIRVDALRRIQSIVQVIINVQNGRV